MSNFKENLLKQDLFNDYIQSFYKKVENENIIIFGTGSGGINSYKLLEANNLKTQIDFFCDNDIQKHGKELFEIKIISSKSLKKIYNNQLIVITCTAVEQVKKQLLKLGIPKERIIFNDFTYNNLKGNYEFINKNLSEFNDIYNILEDQKSKEVFKNLLNYKISYDTKYLKNIVSDYKKKSLDKEIIKLSKNSVYIDCGSYQGDTLLNYINIFGKDYKKIICIEPNEYNFNILLNEIKEKNIEKVECHKIGLWDKNEILKFNIKGAGSGTISDENGLEINVKKLDDILKNEKQVDLIKMDISGSEKKALLGAQKIIKDYKPILAISVYNKIQDFIEIPKIIKSISSEYKIYFRHYSAENECTTTCYAIRG